MYIITDTSSDGRTVYFDGFGFSLIRASAKTMDVCQGIQQRTLICRQFSSCRLVSA